MAGRKLPHGATDDVEDTIRWLEEHGFVVVAARGPEGMGFQSIEYERAGTLVRLGTERDQWMADVREPSWDDWMDLDIVLDAMADRRSWQPRSSASSTLPRQLPAGVSWRRSLPLALAWISGTPDAFATLERLRRRRVESLFPPSSPHDARS